jgi:hypothetical protein
MEKPYMQLDVEFIDGEKKTIQYKKMTEHFVGNGCVQDFYDDKDEVVLSLKGNNLQEAGITSFNQTVHSDTNESPLYRVEVEEVPNSELSNE